MGELVSKFPEFLFFGSVLGFYILTAVFIFFLFVSEVTENGWLASISLVIFLLAVRFFGNFEVEEYIELKMVGIYIGIGLIHSIIRTYFYGRKRGMQLKELKEESTGSVALVDRFSRETLTKLKGNVFRWWFLFPISFLTWVFSDLLRDFWNQVYDLTKKGFEYVLTLGLKSIK